MELSIAFGFKYPHSGGKKDEKGIHGSIHGSLGANHGKPRCESINQSFFASDLAMTADPVSPRQSRVILPGHLAIPNFPITLGQTLDYKILWPPFDHY
jgi:hypothetical protein